MFRALNLLFLVVISSLSAESTKLALSVNAEAAILVNADTGAILYQKNAHEHHYPASITKIATALYAMQIVPNDFDVIITADQDCIGTVTEDALRRSKYTMPAYLLIPDGSHIGIKKGEQLSLRDLLYGMMLASGDDAANVIAKYAGGTIPEFMEGLNTYIGNLGCRDTVFKNPHGLHHPDQHTTAFDMSIMGRELLKNPLLREIVSTVRYTRPKTNKQESYVMIQGNRLLRSGPQYYSKAIGIKTGYYSLAASTLVAAAKDGDRTLIAVLLKTKERKDMFLDANKMFETAFSQPKVERVLLHGGIQKYVLEMPGANIPVRAYLKEDVVIDYYPAEEPAVKCRLYWNQDNKLPIIKNQLIGEVVIESVQGAVLKKSSLYAVDGVEMTWWNSIKSKFSRKSGVIIFLVIVAATIAGYFVLARRR